MPAPPATPLPAAAAGAAPSPRPADAPSDAVASESQERGAPAAHESFVQSYADAESQTASAAAESIAAAPVPDTGGARAQASHAVMVPIDAGAALVQTGATGAVAEPEPILAPTATAAPAASAHPRAFEAAPPNPGAPPAQPEAESPPTRPDSPKGRVQPEGSGMAQVVAQTQDPPPGPDPARAAPPQPGAPNPVSASAARPATSAGTVRSTAWTPDSPPVVRVTERGKDGATQTPPGGAPFGTEGPDAGETRASAAQIARAPTFHWASAEAAAVPQASLALPEGSASAALVPEVQAGRLHSDAAPVVRLPVGPDGQGPALGPEAARKIMDIAVAAMPEATEIRLSPRELGGVRLNVSGEGGLVHVAVSAERPETLELLRRHAGELAAELRSLGYGGASFSFERAPDQRQQAGGDEVHASASPDLQDSPMPAPTATRPIRVPAGSLDIRI